MKEDKTLIERFGKEWGKFWITPGAEVYHRTMVNDDFSLKENAFVMIVDFVIKKPVKTDDSENPQAFRIDGVMCHWLSNGSGTFESRRFHTRELYPLKVVQNGLLEDWLAR